MAGQRTLRVRLLEPGTNTSSEHSGCWTAATGCCRQEWVWSCLRILPMSRTEGDTAVFGSSLTCETMMSGVSGAAAQQLGKRLYFAHGDH
jgi:hypothetical protein